MKLPTDGGCSEFACGDNQSQFIQPLCQFCDVCWGDDFQKLIGSIVFEATNSAGGVVVADTLFP